MAANNVDLQTRIFGDQTFQTVFANSLTHVGFNGNNNDLERIWIVMFRAINKSISTARNENLQIDYNIVQSLQNLRIKSEKIFEYENIRAELENVGLDVRNRNLREIWEELVEAVNNSVSAITDKNLQNDIDTLLRKLTIAQGTIAQGTIAQNENFRNEISNRFGVRNDNLEQICQWKVLRLAVHSSVCACININLADLNIQYTKLRLEQLLLAKRANRNIGNSLDDVLCSPLTHELASRLKSPKDIADRRAKQHLGIKQNTHVDFVTNLIEQQFLIKWNTNVRGEPEEFNFYEFCDVERLEEAQNPENEQMEGKTKHLQYDPRRAHVLVQLYRFCRTRPRREYKKYQLCPPVYIQTTNGWKKWVPSENNNIQQSVHPVADTNTEFHWMNVRIKDYIVSSAIEIDEARLRHTLLAVKRPPIPARPSTRPSTRPPPPSPTLYWAVVNDTDFERGEHLQLNDIGKTQVYVGKAEPGIRTRWITDSKSHCTMMKKCLDNVQEMTTYEPSRFQGIQLVDARLLLAKLREEECALFVMKTYDEPETIASLKADETANIKGKSQTGEKLLTQDWMPKNMAYGMNG